MLGSLDHLGKSGTIRSPGASLSLPVCGLPMSALQHGNFRVVQTLTSCLGLLKCLLWESVGDGWGERREGRHGLELCWQSCILLWPSLESHTASLLACSVASAASLPHPDSRGGNRVPQSVGRKLTGWDMWIFRKYRRPQEDNVWIKKDFIYYFIISPSASPSPSPYYSSSSFFSPVWYMEICSERHAAAGYRDSLMLGWITWTVLQAMEGYWIVFSRCVCVYAHTYICVYLYQCRDIDIM